MRPALGLCLGVSVGFDACCLHQFGNAFSFRFDKAIESRAGHGSGKPTDKVIEEYSDIYAFLAKWTGLKLAE